MDPLLDDPDVRVDVFTNTAGCSVRLVHTPTGIVVSTPHKRAGQLEAKGKAAAELRWRLTLPPESLAALNRCVCGSMRARLEGRNSWAQFDILCPECDA